MISLVVVGLRDEADDDGVVEGGGGNVLDDVGGMVAGGDWTLIA